MGAQHYQAFLLRDDWASIVGNDLAKQCQPLKITTPPPTQKNAKQHTTLYLACALGNQTFLKYQVSFMLEKLAFFYGANAITKISFKPTGDFIK